MKRNTLILHYLKTICHYCSLVTVLLLSLLTGAVYGYDLQLTEAEQEWLTTHPVLRFGFSSSLEPYGVLNQDGTSSGIGADHLNLLAQRLGITIDLELAPWPIILEKAKTRQLDGIPAIPPAHGKRLDLDTSIPVHFNSTPTAYTLEQSPLHINTVEDLAGSTVVILKGMVYAHTFLEPIKDTITIIEVNSSPEAFALLLSNEAHVFLGLNLDYYTITKHFIVGVKPARTFWDSTFNVYLGVRDDEPLLISALQKANASLSSNEISTIRRRWLEIPQDEPHIIFTPKEHEFIKQHPTVQLGIDLNYAPFEFMDKDKGHQGLTADFLKLISSITGLTIRPNPSWGCGDLNRHIDAKKIDLLSLHIKNDGPAPRNLLLSDPIIEVPLVILARQGTDLIANIDTITNQDIGVVQGYYPEAFMQKTYPHATLIPYKTLADGLQGLSTGGCDFFIETLPQANHIIHTENLPGLTLVGQTKKNIEFCFAIRKDLPELQTIINKTLAAIPLEQKLHIRQKLTNLTIPQQTNWRPIVHISFMAITILTILLIWNRRLHQEIKARKKAESSLQLAQLTLDNIPLHIFWFDEDFRVAMANKNAVEITGLSLEELHSTTVWDLDPSFNKEQRHVVWNEVKEKKSIDYLGQLAIRDGSIIPTEESLTYIQTPEGRPYVVSIGTDITNRNVQAKQLQESERKLKEALIKANESSRLKSEFLSNMSHEIRTPLNAIIGYSEMLSQGDLPTNKQRYAQTIIKSGKTLISLINDILDLSKMEAGKMAICPVAINPRLFFENIAQIFEPRLQEKNLDLKISIDPNLPKVLTLDEARLRQVLFNILGNAIKFTQTGYVKLAVTYTPTKPHFGTLTIAISDTGIGIPKEDHLAIFQSFQQQSGGTSRTYGGTGLGLTLSKRFVELMNGEIQLESTPNKGSCFTLILPDIPTSGEVSPEKIVPASSPTIFPKATVLITDDIKTNRDLIKAFLQDTPLTILTASNGKEAVQIAQEQQPDLILMDIKMDIMSGTEAAAILRNSPATSSIPIIALSGLDPDPKLLESFDDFVHKPFSLQIIHQKIHYFLNNSGTTEPQTFSAHLDCKEILPLTPEEANHLLHLIDTANSTGNLADVQTLARKLQQYGRDYTDKTLNQMGSELYKYTKQGAIIHIETLLHELQQLLQEPVS